MYFEIPWLINLNEPDAVRCFWVINDFQNLQLNTHIDIFGHVNHISNMIFCTFSARHNVQAFLQQYIKAGQLLKCHPRGEKLAFSKYF